MQGHGGNKRSNGQGGGGVIRAGQVPIIGQQQIQIDIGATDDDLQPLLAAGQLPMALAIQTLREVRKLGDKIDNTADKGHEFGDDATDES